MSFENQLLQYLLTGLTTGAIYALLALGFVAIYNVTNVINFAQGESAMLGALLMVSFHNDLGWSLPISFLATVGIVAAVGAVLHRVAIRPARHASTVTLIIITIGASIVIRGAALVIWGTDSYALPAFTPGRPLGLGDAVIPLQSLWVFGAALASVLGLLLFFRYTRLGKAVRACAVNPLAARYMGINHDHMAMLAFALGAGLGAIGGAVIAPITYATYDMGAMLGLKGFVAAILGGLSSSPGCVAAGLLLGVLESFGAGLISSGAKNAIAFAILLGVLFFRPSGLFAGRRVEHGGL